MSLENAKNIKNTKLCNSCKYRCRFGSMYTNKTQGFCCNYYEIMGQSRLMDENGVNHRLDPEWEGKCDKYKRGPIAQVTKHINLGRNEYEDYHWRYREGWVMDRSKYKD